MLLSALVLQLFLAVSGQLTNQDYILLRDSIKEFIKTNDKGPERNIPLLVRSSFHDVATTAGDLNGRTFGSNGCLLTVGTFQNALGNSGLSTILSQLNNYVSSKFSGKNFPHGDILSLAGKVAIEMANPCMKIDWSFGRPGCQQQRPGGRLPAGNSHGPIDLHDSLFRYNLSFLEMGVLIAGGHGLKGAQSTASGFSQKPFATQNSGKAWLADTFNLVWGLNWFNLVKSTQSQQLRYARTCPPNTPGGCFGYVTGWVYYFDYSRPSRGNYEVRSGELLRFPSDIVFFPSVMEKYNLPAKSVEHPFILAGSLVDDTLPLTSNQMTRDTEVQLKRYTELDRSVFDQHFERVFAKMLLVGIEKPDLLTRFEEPEPRGKCE